MSTRDKTGARPAREIAEEAFHLLRAAPVSAWGSYFLGSMPFCAALVYFVNAMEVYAYAERDLPLMALALSGLFVWMKTWQARYAEELFAVLRGEAAPVWGGRRFLRTVYNQTVLQTSGLIVLPFAFLTMLLFVPAVSFYQNVTALDASGTRGSLELFGVARQEAARWHKQAYVIQWMLSPAILLVVGALYWVMPVVAQALGFVPEMYVAVWLLIMVPLMLPLCPLGVVLALNLAATVFFGAAMLKMFFDINTMFTWAPGAMANRAFMTGLLACCYLVMDPLFKAAYVLRCYYGLSLRTGEDIRGTLRRVTATAQAGAMLIAVGAAVLGATHARADELPAPTENAPTVDAQRIDSALQRELEDPVYTWRMPREHVDPNDQEKSLYQQFTDWLKAKLKAFFAWLRDFMKRFERDQDARAGGGGAGTAAAVKMAMETILIVLAVALAVMVLVFAARQWNAFRQETSQLEMAAVVEAPVQIEDESARADALPEDGWLKLARELHARGEFRLAMRAVFLAMLSSLASRGMIQIVRYKSNLDYQRELKRRTQPEAFAAFRKGVLLYECVWYGEHPASAESFDELYAEQDKVRRA